MNMSRLVGLALVFVMPQAWADYECVAGYRDTTTAERDTMRAALETARNALPPAPEGWIVADNESISVIERLCRDFEQRTFSYGYQRRYDRVDDMEARDQLLREAGSGIMADIAAKQDRIDAIMRRVQELSEQAVAAAERQDYDRIDAINRDIEVATAEYSALLAEGDADDAMQAAQVEYSRDATMSVYIAFNGTHDSPGYGARRWSPAGVPGTVYRWRGTGDNANMDNALILLGNWQPNGNGGYEHSPDVGAGAALAQSASIRVTADPGRLEQTVAAIDFSALENLLAGN